MQARRANILAEGLVAGVVAHLAIALVLVFSDLFAGRAVLYTPTLVGSVLLEGGRQGCQVTPNATILLAYSSVHLSTLVLFGFLGSWLIQGSQERPILWFGALCVFIFVAWHVSAAALGLLGRAQECLSLWPATLAGFAGSLAMAGYLWRSHPWLRQALRGERYA
jgi:hypothetical protein